MSETAAELREKMAEAIGGGRLSAMRESTANYWLAQADKAIAAMPAQAALAARARADALEEAAKAAERHVPSSPSASGESWMRRNGQDIAAKIRALAKPTPQEDGR